MAQKVIVKTAFPKLSDSEALAIAGAVIKDIRTHARYPLRHPGTCSGRLPW